MKRADDAHRDRISRLERESQAKARTRAPHSQDEEIRRGAALVEALKRAMGDIEGGLIAERAATERLQSECVETDDRAQLTRKRRRDAAVHEAAVLADKACEMQRALHDSKQWCGCAAFLKALTRVRGSHEHLLDKLARQGLDLRVKRAGVSLGAAESQWEDDAGRLRRGRGLALPRSAVAMPASGEEASELADLQREVSDLQRRNHALEEQARTGIAATPIAAEVAAELVRVVQAGRRERAAMLARMAAERAAAWAAERSLRAAERRAERYKVRARFCARCEELTGARAGGCEVWKIFGEARGERARRIPRASGTRAVSLGAGAASPIVSCRCLHGFRFYSRKRLERCCADVCGDKGASLLACRVLRGDAVAATREAFKAKYIDAMTLEARRNLVPR